MLQQYKTISNKLINKSTLVEIASLKSEYWKYPVESQIEWISEHYSDNDLHLLVYKNNILVAYAGLIFSECIIDGIMTKFCGLGNVCVRGTERGTGIGLQLVCRANEIIKANKIEGLLLCHKNLVSFYEKCGWTLLSIKRATVDVNEFTENIMAINTDRTSNSCIEFKLNF